jgi:glycerol-3-phosphate dehydrogenase
MANTASSIIDVNVDVLIIGGGIAGLGTLAKLKQAGYKAVLLESEALGAGQTRFAQGIIHGGTKYALTGKLTASSEAVAGMPALWRDCLQGKGEIDLSQAILLSDAHYLWSTSSLTSRVSGFFASKVMRSRTNEVEKNSRPELFDRADFKGQIYALDEPVFDTLSVVRAIAEPLKQSILAVRKDKFQIQGNSLIVESVEGQRYVFNYQKLVLMAGQGNQAILSALKIQKPEMQRRPLKMVIVRGGLQDMIYAHCMGASVNPRVTITSHYDKHGDIVWYLGGQLAEDGVNRSDAEQINAAKKELAELIPWLDLSGSQWAILDIDRAEVKKEGSKRPDTFFAEEMDNVITAWPTKMALSPVLAEHIVAMVKAAAIECVTNNDLPSWPHVPYSELPWQEESRWKP